MACGLAAIRHVTNCLRQRPFAGHNSSPRFSKSVVDSTATRRYDSRMTSAILRFTKGTVQLAFIAALAAPCSLGQSSAQMNPLPAEERDALVALAACWAAPLPRPLPGRPADRSKRPPDRHSPSRDFPDRARHRNRRGSRAGEASAQGPAAAQHLAARPTQSPAVQMLLRLGHVLPVQVGFQQLGVGRRNPPPACAARAVPPRSARPAPTGFRKGAPPACIRLFPRQPRCNRTIRDYGTPLASHYYADPLT